jgi:hypothetical protein
VPERKEPEFTVRQQGGRGGGGREVDGNSVGYRRRLAAARAGFGQGGGHFAVRLAAPRAGQRRPGPEAVPARRQRGGRPDGAGQSRRPARARLGPPPRRTL